MVRFVSKEALVKRNIERRKNRLLEAKHMDDRMRRQMLDELENGQIPTARIASDDFDIRQVIDVNAETVNGSRAYRVRESALGTGDFNVNWVTRRRYEIDAGREEEPILYPAIYNVTTDSTLPKTVDIYTLGDAGVVFEEVQEGGEVKFASVSEGSKTVTMRHFAVGLSYTEDIFIYNELWRLSNLERQFGIAHNALLNHIHMSPILTYSYAAANQTDGTALTSFRADASLPEKYLRTLEAAITEATDDTTNPRRGPYAILCSTGDAFTFRRALSRVPQEGIDVQGDVLDQIQSIVAYNGWSGTRGGKQESYAGVTTGKAYLVNLANRNMDFQSFFKQPLREQMIAGDMSRFIMEKVMYDTRFGVFSDPVRSVHEITLPGATDGAS